MSEHAEHETTTAHGGGHAEGHTAGLGTLFFPALNFALFVGLLVYFLRGPVREYFRERTERLRDALAAGARARQEAAALRAQLMRDMENLPAVKEQLRNDLRLTAERERDRTLTLARQAAERMRTDAQQLAVHEFQAARDALRAEVIEETVRQATAILRNRVRPEDQARFVRDFVQTGEVPA